MATMSKTRARKLLIFLYLKFEGNQDEIMREILEKKLGATEKVVNAYLKDNNIDCNKYCTYIDKDYPKDMQDDIEHPILVFER